LLSNLSPGAGFHNPPLIQDRDITRPADSGKPLGNNNHGQFPMKPLEGILDV